MFIKAAYVLIPFLSTVFGENECKQIDACRCRLKNGSEINLHRSINSGSPVFKVSDSKQVYNYSPCKGLICGQGVTNSSICSTEGKVNTSLGDVPSSRFEYNKTTGVWTLIYLSKGNKTKSIVQLKCNPSVEFKVDPKYNATVYRFNLSSPCVCPDGCIPERTSMSPGTILLLIFFSILLIYFGVGSLYRKSVYGAEGRNIIPHNAFWFSLPGLIRDGYLFFISPCLGERVEYRYYDRL